MKMKYLILPFLVIGLLVVSCKKRVIEPLDGDSAPVFYMSGDFGGQEINYVAGDNGFVMTSGVEVRNGVNYAYTLFSDGQTKYKIGIFDGNVAIPNFNKGFLAGDTLHFASAPTQTLAYLSTSLMTNAVSIQNVDWYINDVLQDGGNDNVSITEPGVYFVRGDFTFNDVNSTLKKVTNRMYLGFENDVDFSLRHLVVDGYEVKLWTEGDLSKIDSVQWFIDGQYDWTAMACTRYIGPNIKDITAKAFYNNGAVQQKKIVVDGSQEGRYIEDFDIFKTPDPILPWDYQVGIEVERDGETFSSFGVSNNKGTILVKKVEAYIHPITGEQMIRLVTEIDTKLKSISTGDLIETKLNAILGFPLPQ